MSRKALIFCVAALTVMMIAVGVAVAFLYSGTDRSGKAKTMDSQSRYLLLNAVPSDAVAVCCLSKASSVADGPLSGFDFPSALTKAFDEGSLSSLSSSRFAVSLHYSGNLVPLYLFDAGRSGEGASKAAAELVAFAEEQGLHAIYAQGSLPNGRSVVLASPLEGLLNSSRRHLEQGISIMDAKGFAKAAGVSDSEDLIFFSNASSRVLLRGCLNNVSYQLSDFFSSLAEWTVLSLREMEHSSLRASLHASYTNDVADFMNVLDAVSPSVSKATSILPSYVSSVLVLPVSSYEGYVEAYRKYLDSKQELSAYNKRLRTLQEKNKLPVDVFFKRLGVKEIVSASMDCGGRMEKVNLMRISKADTLVARIAGVSEFDGCTGKVMPYAFEGYAGAMFGGLWSINDESCFTYKDNWIISGSRKAVQEYASGRALEYTLRSWFDDAGVEDKLAYDAVASCYLALNQPQSGFKGNFRQAVLSRYSSGDAAPVFMNLSNDKKKIAAQLHISSHDVKRTRAPKFERDTVVNVPKGPFTIKNSSTGKNNQIYQNSHLSICLRDENGKDKWGVVFKEPICGTVHNLDYYGNGKLQMVFGAGSRIYVIDRLGTFVSGFPVDLGKDILLGPDIYDFSGANAYNIMVLHKDNTIEMYNLKARKPSSWKGITHKEKIKSLPERLLVGGRNFWVVRTSIQAIIYPFNGGEPITTYEGDKMIRPDSEVRIIDSSSVEVTSYDGQKRVVKLK